MSYLVVSDETDSVIAEDRDLAQALTLARDLGYVSGYVTNQDGARQDLAEALNGRDIHLWGDLESSHFAGNPHRKCLVEGCRFINAYDDELTPEYADYEKEN